MRRPVVIIDAPTNLGLRSDALGCGDGTARAPEALRAAGLHRALSSKRIVTLDRPQRSVDEPPKQRFLNETSLLAYLDTIAESVGIALDEGAFPLLIGGDCSIFLGALGALCPRGDVGLVHVDGHADFRHRGNGLISPGAAAGMDLAMATGRCGPLFGCLKLVADSNCAHLGDKEFGDRDYAFHDIIQTPIGFWPLGRLFDLTTEIAATHALAAISAPAIWLHIDVDVLSATVMPAVDCPDDRGLQPAQLVTLLKTLLADERIRGASYCIYDPYLDTDGSCARILTEIATSVFARSR